MVAPVIEPVIEPEEDMEVQEVVNEDLKKASSKGESLFQVTGYTVDWKGDFHKVSQEELNDLHEDDEDDGWGNSYYDSSYSIIPLDEDIDEDIF